MSGSVPDAGTTAGTTTSPATGPAAEPADTELPPPAFHADSQALRFYVRIPGQPAIGASISRLVLHHRFKASLDGSDAATVYAANRAAIDAAVLRRAQAGSLEPVMLREHDLAIAAR